MEQELDLDSFLRRHNAISGESSDDNSDTDHQTLNHHHRTVDDILNDSDSSASSSPPPSTSRVYNDSLKAFTSIEKPPNPTLLKYNLIQRLKSDEFSFRKSSSSVFSGGVRSPAKPGVALAAAAAASRSVPLRHADVIREKRFLSVNMEGKISDGDELVGFSKDDEVSERNSANDRVDLKSEVDESLSERIEEKDSDFVDSSEKIVEESGESVIDRCGSDKRERDSNLVDSSLESKIEMSLVDEVDMSKNNKGANSESKDVDVKVNEGLVDEQVGTSLELDDEGTREQDLGLEHENSGSNIGVESDVENVDDDDLGVLVEDRIAELAREGESKEEEEKVVSVKTALELAEELEKKQASSGLDLEEGAAAQPMRLEGVRSASTVLGYFDIDAENSITRMIKSQVFRRDYGMPQVLAVHLNYIALGMSKGVVVVVPSKYSAQHLDNMEAKMLMLGTQGDRSQVPVTSICFNQQGDLLLAGYGDGHITIWNIPKGTVAKVITGDHSAPVVHVLFLGQDSQVTRQFKAVTGDCKGLVLLHELSMMPFVGFSSKSQCLLDGQRTGTVLCASPLLPDEFAGGAPVTSNAHTSSSASSIGGVMGGVVGGAAGWKLFSEGSPLPEEGVVIFVTHQTALVVKLTPSLEVYASLPKPEGVRDGAMPYTAWKCTIQTHGSATEHVNPEALEKISLLAIAWDRKVQVAKLVKSELKVCGKWTLESSAVGLAWLDDQMLVILTLSGQLCLFTWDGILIHQTSYAIDGFEGDDLIAYHTYFTNAFGNPEKAYHNNVAIRGASVYVLGPMHIATARLLPWKERIQVLRKAGDWMGALNMALTLYDGQAHGVIDLPRNLHAVQDALMPHLVELLFSYVDEVFSYISVACFNQIEKMEDIDGSQSSSRSAYSEIKEQFTRVGGVAVEFCVHIKRTDILFDKIYAKFVAVQHRDTFLELLEPYILKDMLGSLPPEIMQALVEHYNTKGWLQRVEQCVLHMDISSLDFNQVVRLCRENRLYGALIYLFNKGLDDFKTPLEELLSVLRSKERNDTVTCVGYRMLVYLKYCFSGLAFPPGHGTLSSERLPSLRTELLQSLLEDSGGSKSHRAASLTSTGAYPNLYYLLELDTEATLDILRIAFGEGGNFNPVKSLLQSSNLNNDSVMKDDLTTGNQEILVQKTVDALVVILDVDISQTARSTGSDNVGLELWPSKKDIGHLIEFIASYVASKRADVSKSVLSQIVEFLTSEDSFSTNGLEQKNESKKRREKKVLALLNAVPQVEWNALYVLHLCEKAQFYQVCGLIHYIRHQYVAALDSYMKDRDAPVYAFSFINGILQEQGEAESVSFRSAVISRIPELVILSRECALHLIIDYFNNASTSVISELRSNRKSLFLYLKTLVEAYSSSTLNLSCIRTDDVTDGSCGGSVGHGANFLEAYLERISAFSKSIRDRPVEVTDDMVELYVELLCQFEPDSVLKFLDTFENYQVDRCLQLCQKYGIVDAAAFLLERVGDVGSALVLSLSGINEKFIKLDSAVANMISPISRSKHAYSEYFTATTGLIEVRDIQKLLCTCIGLCQRNTPRLDPEESESLWFHLLDSFCKPLTIPESIESGIVNVSSSSKDDREVNTVTWRVPQSQKHAPLLKQLFSQFVKEIVEGMIGYIRLPSIMAKLLSDNGAQEFGDFKLTIMGMLGTYGFERRILDTARSLIEDDTFYNMSVLKKGASKGYAPRSISCCICNNFFTKSSTGSGIQVFSCGHAAHLQCEIQENGTSGYSFSNGCPICVHKKKVQKTKGKMVEQGLVSAPQSRSKRALTPVQHSHELDAFENSSTSHQISRFDILNSLQKNQRMSQTETMPQLRLAPPAIYHEKINKRSFHSNGSSGGLVGSEKPNKNGHLRDVKVKGPSIRFPLKSKIFGKEKTRVQ